MEHFQTIDILIFLAYVLVFLCIVTNLTSTILGGFFFYFHAITNLERDSLYFHLLRVNLLLPLEEILSFGEFSQTQRKNPTMG